ncbi:CPBP family intramembrane metalloprotease [filamentous cyanobacterium CCP5]|nr:CPBP family intramembrane metalloprotease [filamentous cyanobacterium CCP5]
MAIAPLYQVPATSASASPREVELDRPYYQATMRHLILRQPFWAFMIAAYGFSWTFWLLSFQVSGSPSVFLFHLAGFGPLIAAMVVVRDQGRSLRAWLVGLFKWRLHPGWYGFALGWPILLAAIASLGYRLLGYSLDFSLLPGRLGIYLPSLLLLAIAGGGNEEPGWRGLGLPVLQQRHRPIVATTVLGIVWALWHLPLLAVNPDVASGAIGPGQILFITTTTLISITTHAFWYTWLINRTGSVLLCILLHASYNAANGLLILIPDEALRGSSYQVLLILMTAVLIASVVGLLIHTKGRLGLSQAGILPARGR